MSICLDPTHLVTCLLIHFPQLFSLVTLIIAPFIISLCCSSVWVCYLMLDVVCVLPCPALFSLVLPCPALPCLLASQSVFHPTGWFLFVLFFVKNKSPFTSSP